MFTIKTSLTYYNYKSWIFNFEIKDNVLEIKASCPRQEYLGQPLWGWEIMKRSATITAMKISVEKKIPSKIHMRMIFLFWYKL